jgi:phosphoribosylpyrophosphate synthetase
MKIFKKGGPHQPTKIQKRIASISTPELVTWVETHLYIIGKETTGWLKTKESFLLDDSISASETLVDILKELKKRANEF